MSKRGRLEERQRAKSGRKFDSRVEASFRKSRKRENTRRGKTEVAFALAAANIGGGGGNVETLVGGLYRQANESEPEKMK